MIPILILLVAFACDKEKNIEKDCLKKILKQKGMIKYQGQELGCSSFLELYVFNEKKYFLKQNHCADLISNGPFDCDGNKLCEDYNSMDCINFREKAEFKGIVGIQIQ